MSADITSEAINLVKKEGVAVQAIFTGSPTGTLKIEGSIDGINYTAITETSLSITEAGDVLYNLRDVNYLWARLRWVFTSGTGVLNAFFATKEDE